LPLHSVVSHRLQSAGSGRLPDRNETARPALKRHSWPYQRIVGLARKRSFGGVEALGEPAVDRREQLVSRRVTVMVAPEPGEANSGAIPRAWLPVLGQCSGPGGTAPRQPRCTPAQLQLAFAPIQLGGKPALAGPFDDTQCIVQQTHRLRELRGNVARARQ